MHDVFDLAWIIVVVAVTATSGCSSEQVYNSGQAWQRNECEKLLDHGKRERCLNEANTSYPDYRRQTEDDKKQ